MKYQKNIFPVYIGVLLLAFVLLPDSRAHAEEFFSMADELSSTVYNESPFPLTASVMEKDIANNIIIVAEQYIHLKSTVQDGKKIWITKFLDADNHTISPEKLGIREQVLVEGKLAENGTLEADSIQLCPSSRNNFENVAISDKGESKNESNTVEEAVKSTSVKQSDSNELIFENGVWHN